jgi:hypothetical protein
MAAQEYLRRLAIKDQVKKNGEPANERKTSAVKSFAFVY